MLYIITLSKKLKLILHAGISIYCTRRVKMNLTLCVGMSTVLDPTECETENNAVCWNFQHIEKETKTNTACWNSRYCTRKVKMKLTVCWNVQTPMSEKMKLILHFEMSSILDPTELKTETNTACWNFWSISLVE